MRVTEYFNSENALILSGVLAMAAVGALTAFIMQNSSLLPVVLSLSITQLLCFVAFVFGSNYSRRVLVNLFWVEAVCIVTLYFLVNSSLLAILSIVWIVQAAELYGSRSASWLLLGSVSFLTASALYHAGGAATLNVIVNAALSGLFQLLALSATLRTISERQLREETGALNRELIATRELLSQSTAQSERVRIARDLHDILGHHMTALILNLEVAKHNAEGLVREKVEQSLALAKLLLGDLRTTVSELRDDEAIDLQHSINTLVAGIPRLEIDVDFSAAPSIKDVDLAETLLRCTQEAITNVLRHSAATQCRIAVVGVGDKCILTVSDNGDSKPEIVPGNGLKGMTERVADNGGELSWQQTDSGFSLRVELLMGSA
jgi:signal transduction histidine kinase